MSRAAPEDLLLVEGLRTRDERAVEEFLARYKSLLHHCIGQFTHDATEREDLYQDLVIHALDRLDRDAFDPEKGGFGTWLALTLKTSFAPASASRTERARPMPLAAPVTTATWSRRDSMPRG